MADDTPVIPLVMVAPTKLLHDLGYFTGFNADTAKYLDTIFSPEHTKYLPRPEMEEDPTYKQLIPYVVFRQLSERKETLFFVYTRTKLQGEQRLHGKRSLGIGGHIEIHDAAKGVPYEMALIRELVEEVKGKYEVGSPVGLINDDSNAVGKVHLGVVHFADVQEPDSLEPAEVEEMADPGFRTAGWLAEHLQEFENWSQIVIQQLLLGTNGGTLERVTPATAS